MHPIIFTNFPAGQIPEISLSPWFVGLVIYAAVIATIACIIAITRR